jgi:RNA polymerase sigma-70 factor, ECF subfamily
MCNGESVMTHDVQEVWLRVHDGLRAFITKRVANQTEIDDIVQEVFLRMHRKLDSLKDPRRIVSWVFQITRHVIVDHYRSPKRRREVPAGLAGDIDLAHPTSALSTFSKASGQLRTELASCLRPMIEQLSSEYREAVTLVELEGLTQNTAAQRLSLSVSGMKSRVQRGRQQLKQMLERCCVIELDRRRGIVNYTLRDSSCQSCRLSSCKVSFPSLA